MKEPEEDEQGIIDKIKEYVKVRKELTILNIADKTSQLFANLVTDSIVVIFITLAFLFGSLGLSLYLSEIIGNSYSGFLIVAGLYLLIGVIIYAVKDKYLEKRIINGVIKKFFKERNEGIYDGPITHRAAPVVNE